MKRRTISTFCLIPLLIVLLSCQKESIEADYQIIPLPQQIQIVSNENHLSSTSGHVSYTQKKTKGLKIVRNCWHNI